MYDVRIAEDFGKLESLKVFYKVRGGKKETVAVLFDGEGIEESVWDEVREILDGVLRMILG